MEDSICKNCNNVSNCQYFIDILKQDEQNNNKYNQEISIYTVIYKCHKYKNKNTVDENSDSGGWVGYHKWS